MYEYKITFQVYQTNENIRERVNSITFTNRGGLCTINQNRVETNQTLAISGNAGEINDQEYQIMFPDPNAATNNLLVTFKKYTNE